MTKTTLVHVKEKKSFGKPQTLEKFVSVPVNERNNLLAYNIPGIYQIFCTKNKKTYIGQNFCIAVRIGDHLKGLRLGVHQSNELQEDWNEYGSQSFEAYAIEICVTDDVSSSELKERERIYLHHLLDQNRVVYNTDQMNYNYDNNTDGTKISNNGGLKEKKHIVEKIVYKGVSYSNYSEVLDVRNKKRVSIGKKPYSGTHGSHMMRQKKRVDRQGLPLLISPKNITIIKYMTLMAKHSKSADYMRYERLLNNQVTMTDTDSCLEILKVKILNKSQTKKQTWSHHFHGLRFKKYRQFNPILIESLEKWYSSPDFNKDLKQFVHNLNTINNSVYNSLLNSKIFKPPGNNKPRGKGFGFSKKQSNNAQPKLTDREKKLHFIKKRTLDSPEKFVSLWWSKLYKIFPTKISVFETDKCLEILKIRTCNLLLKKSWLLANTDWDTIENSIGTRNYVLANATLAKKLQKWYQSKQFYADFNQFKINYEIDSHPSLDF